MVPHFKGYGGGVPSYGAERKTVQVEVVQALGRYHNHLDHAITNTDWTPEEERLLFEMQEMIGNKWALISNRLPGR